ncbi:hypothetical protein VDGL01_11081 [Verticillium dahliae]
MAPPPHFLLLAPMADMAINHPSPAQNALVGAILKLLFRLLVFACIARRPCPSYEHLAILSSHFVRFFRSQPSVWPAQRWKTALAFQLHDPFSDKALAKAVGRLALHWLDWGLRAGGWDHDCAGEVRGSAKDREFDEMAHNGPSP